MDVFYQYKGTIQYTELINREEDNRSTFCHIRIAKVNKYQQISKCWGWWGGGGAQTVNPMGLDQSIFLLLQT